MTVRREKAEHIVMKLRQVEVLQGQGKSVSDAVRHIGVTVQTYYRWRREYGGMSRIFLYRMGFNVLIIAGVSAVYLRYVSAS